MDIHELTQEMHKFVRSMGWYAPTSKRPQTIRNLAVSLNLEASEVLEHFQWNDDPTDQTALAGELADVSLYLLQLASLSGIDLEQAILSKLQVNYQRVWDGEPGSELPLTGNSNSESDQVKSPTSKRDSPWITVFGGSQPKPGEPVYLEAQHLGNLLGGLRYTVLNGGYIGTMEAVSKGAAEVGGHVIGVTCDEIEAWRPVKPNSWITEELRFSTLRQRMFALIDSCDAALALPGGIGTLTEVSMMWNHLVTDAITPRPLIVIGAGWEAVINAFYTFHSNFIPENQRIWLHKAIDVDDAVRQLREMLSSGKV